jgi:hypothetical protein
VIRRGPPASGHTAVGLFVKKGKAGAEVAIRVQPGDVQVVALTIKR